MLKPLRTALTFNAMCQTCYFLDGSMQNQIDPTSSSSKLFGPKKSQFGQLGFNALLSKLLLPCTSSAESGFQARTANCVFCSVTGRLQFRPGFISGYERSPRNYAVKLHFPQRTNKVLGAHSRARVDPFSMLGGRSAGNGPGHESALCGGSRGSVQTVDHLSLSPSLLSSPPSDSHFFPSPD